MRSLAELVSGMSNAGLGTPQRDTESALGKGSDPLSSAVGVPAQGVQAMSGCGLEGGTYPAGRNKPLCDVEKVFPTRRYRPDWYPASHEPLCDVEVEFSSCWYLPKRNRQVRSLAC